MNLKYRGFTLIELLVALTILAIVGVLMAMALRTAVSTQQRLSKKAEELTSIQTAIIIIERDLSQMINRTILDASSELHPAIELRKSNRDMTFEFTRAGVINPYSIQNRSTLQRISYHYDGKNLTRIFWKHLDRTKETPQESQRLLTDLTACNINLIKKDDQNSGGIPANPEQTLPMAIEITLESASFGIVNRFIKLVGEIAL